MLILDNVTRRFRAPGVDVTALRDVSLEVPAGGVWAVVGPNGAGKTTLFGLALGFLRATAGRVTLGGEAPRRFVGRHGAAYLPERFTLPTGWRVRAVLEAFARLDGCRAATARARADQAMERLGLDAYAGRPVGALSHGLLQRVGLAQALLTSRPVVVLDEPTEGLDPLWRIRLRDLVAELRNPDRLVLIASHALAEVERVADHVVLLEDGRLKQIMDVAESARPVRYRVRLARPSPIVAQVFPDAALLEAPAEYVVVVADAVELSERIAALLRRDVTLEEVTPLVEPLEQRVRQALDGRASDEPTAGHVNGEPTAGHVNGEPADRRVNGEPPDGGVDP